jgi:hypothetical protein
LKRKAVWATAIWVLTLSMAVARAQDNNTPAPGSTADTSPQEPQQPVPGFGQENAPAPTVENPPISGLDQPGLEPHAAPLNYLRPGATVSESVDSNVENTPGSGAVRSISRGLGSLTLQRLWSRYDLAAQYMGGVAYYDQKGIGWTSMQQLNLDQRINWKRGQLALRDSFSYLPEGNFGAAYGTLGSEGISSLGSSSFGGFWGGSAFGTLGFVPRVMNLSLADITENLSPRSILTAAGGYAFTHFYGSDPFSGTTYLNNSQVSAQVGFDRILTSRTQVAVLYGYQGFDFSSVGTSFHSHVIEGMYGHRITGRMDFLIEAGPQITDVNLRSVVCSDASLPPTVGGCTAPAVLITQSSSDHRIGVAGRVQLRYQLKRTGLTMGYQRFLSSGSGFFAGAQTDVAVLRVEHPVSRVWNAFLDLGYTRNSRVQPLTAQALASCNFPGSTSPNPSLPTCPGVNAARYSFGYAGIGVQRAFGRNFHGFASFQFNELGFDNSYCGGLPACNRISNRQVGTIGLDWTPRPIRLD